MASKDLCPPSLDLQPMCIDTSLGARIMRKSTTKPGCHERIGEVRDGLNPTRLSASRFLMCVDARKKATFTTRALELLTDYGELNLRTFTWEITSLFPSIDSVDCWRLIILNLHSATMVLCPTGQGTSLWRWDPPGDCRVNAAYSHPTQFHMPWKESAPSMLAL